MVTRHALALVVAAAAIAACDGSGAVAAPAPTGVATWRPQAILPFDAPRFDAAARAGGVVVGDETEWVELPDGWMPVDASDASPHYGLVAAPGGLVAWQAGGHPMAPATNGVAAVIREIGARIVVFGYVMQDAGNGGDWPVAHLVWTLEPPG
jgi:hypothetical protein